MTDPKLAASRISTGRAQGAEARRHLHPGEAVTSSDLSVTMVLGSCVAVCISDAEARIGGVSHFILPRSPGNDAPSLRYGFTAIPLLVREMVDLGAQTRRMRARLYGGATLRTSPFAPAIGERNIQVAREALGELGIPIVSLDVGGDVGRRLDVHIYEGVGSVQLLGPEESHGRR